MRVTLKMIAERAGVHISTVDKVIHNRGGVSKEVEANIRSIIRELGYKPNPAGRALQRSGTSYLIRAILLEVDAQPYIAEGIRRELAGINFDLDVEFVSTPFLDVEGQAALLKQALEDRVNGVILMPNYSPVTEEAVRRLVENKIPVVTVDSDLRDSGRLCHIGQDAVKGARIAGRMMGLFLRGKGRTAVITNSLDEDRYHDQVKTREKEFTAFLQNHFPGIEIVRYVEGYEDRERTLLETAKLLREEQDLKGIFVACGGVDAVGRAVREAGRARQTSVISFEEYPEILDLIRSDVVDCTIGGSLVETGQKGLSVLVDYLVYGQKPAKETIFMDARILVKESL
ncbi:MAG: LacI family DNA-binding transcriptional regulator [Lachnospiraceae bacterium]|nr:LacI family DNA-binding transcriptional regulator [Lachnospiraceae bacterium]